jgi:transposase
VHHIGSVSDVSVRDVLAQLDVSPATYYRWKARAERDRLADALTPRRQPSLPPTPQERVAVCDFARAHPLMGYKRLAWDMVDRDIAYLRPGQVYQVLQAADLLARRPPLVSDPLRRPVPPERPDQV